VGRVHYCTSLQEGDVTDCSNYLKISRFSTSYKILSDIISRLSPYADEIIWDHQCISVDFDVTDQQLNRFLHLSDIGKEWENIGTVHRLIINFKKAYDSVRKEVLCNILIEFGDS
jgi:hypothetical protein